MHFGVGELNNTAIDSDGYSGHPPGFEFKQDKTAIVGGFLVGRNWQMGDWVVGVEADVTAGDLHVSSFDFDRVQYDENVESIIHWSSTIRCRAGYDLGRFFPYITGGIAVAEMTNRLTDYDGSPFIKDPTDSYSKTENVCGWGLGGGSEFAVSDSWRLRLEGLFTDYDRKDNEIANGNATFGQSSEVFTARVGVLYRF